jgi:hypothetical protein
VRYFVPGTTHLVYVGRTLQSDSFSFSSNSAPSGFDSHSVGLESPTCVSPAVQIAVDSRKTKKGAV